MEIAAQCRAPFTRMPEHVWDSQVRDDLARKERDTLDWVMGFAERGGENVRKSPNSGVASHPPRTRQVRVTHETGTSQAQAGGKGRPSVSTGLMDSGTGSDRNGA